MKKKLIALLLAMVMVFSLVPMAAFADDGDTGTTNPPPTVTVYLSISDDDKFVTGNGSVMALKEITVPYFDLANYGLEDFYFSSEDYDEEPGWAGTDPENPLPPKSHLTPGTQDYAAGFITMLHVFIYALEVYKEGNNPSVVFEQHRSLPTGDLNISGSVGSMFMENFWGMDLNLNYYKNYEYPLASEGWGATADQILVHDGDIITVGHFTSWDFYSDPSGIFNYAKLNGNKGPVTVTKGGNVTLDFFHAGVDFYSFTETAHTPLSGGQGVFATPVNNVASGDFCGWSPVGTVNSDGQAIINTSNLAAGKYIVAVPGQRGVSVDAICSTPGGIILDVGVKYGDVDGDGIVTQEDIAMIRAYIDDEIDFNDFQCSAADVDEDGEITSSDIFYITGFINGSISSLPIE